MSIKILADREDIVRIADAMRSKTGSTEEMTLGGMAENVSNISGAEDLDAELIEQESLIAELSETLDSKASGSGGNGSVETCTVSGNLPDGSFNRCFATRYVDGAIAADLGYLYGEQSFSLTDVVCGSAMTLYASMNSKNLSIELTNATLTEKLFEDIAGVCIYFITTGPSA